MSLILDQIKSAYEHSLRIRDQRIVQFITQDKVFGITSKKDQYDEKINLLLTQNEETHNENIKLNMEISKLKNYCAKLKDEGFSEYLSLMRERDARYSLFFENVALQTKVRELDGSSPSEARLGDPVVLAIALERCREQLSSSQNELKKMREDYSETVPRREYDNLESRFFNLEKQMKSMNNEYDSLQTNYKRALAKKKCLEEELSEYKDRCRELEKAGTPRPQWDICGDFISGGRDRWWQLADELSSRDKLRVLLKELGPAAESEHLEYFDGLGLDPAIPPYLRYEGKVRNLRLSRRELSVIINDIWLSKMHHGQDMPMQDFVTKYFENRLVLTFIIIIIIITAGRQQVSSVLKEASCMTRVLVGNARTALL
ncbi:translin-associated factor X-interacting protein 1-like [Leptidea sinapis]|uniref:translin-associated factor X-interacting protein 1-like n=1 Tax=Leptidea sinapis TaxID=189913 RepID=UPI0021C466C5|nr:translin-associated factor X-interacting protein 1-like [Leptidea sinapis]